MSSPSDETFIAEVLRALNDVGLEAIAVGNVAAGLQGSPIFTLVLDLLVRDTPANREKIEQFAERLNAARPISVGPLTNTLRIIGASAPVDIMFDQISGSLSFQTLRSRSQNIAVAGQTATVASLADVIASKAAADRPKDRAQLPILRDTLRVKEALDKTRKDS